MPSTARPRDHLFPLHVHISLLFTLLLLLTGVALGLFNYQQNTQIILSSSAKLFERIQQDVQEDLQHTYQPIRRLLSLLTRAEQIHGHDRYERMALLPLFAQALRDNPKLASLYLGYGDGDFFMVRPLRSDSLKNAFDAPPDAAFQVWSINRLGQARPDSEYQFFDDNLQLLSWRQNLKERYDPRSRPWYSSALASDQHFTTAPYVFFSTGEVGTTIARHGTGETVLGADLTLADLSATLAQHQVTSNSQVVLFDASGNAVAYPDSARLVMTNNGEPHLIPARELSAELAALFADGLDGSRQGVMELSKQRWVVSRHHLQEGGPQGLYLALLVPEDELLADAYRIRWQGALITLTTLLLCLPLGWLTSRIVAKPLRALVLEAQAIRRFDFSYPPSGHSPVLEVDQLAESMARMKETISSFLDIAASLCAETHFDALLERILQETVTISAAHGGLIYLIDADSGRLEPHGLFLNGTQHSLGKHGIRGYAKAASQLPTWLQQAASGGNSAITSLGFDQAGDYRSLLQALDSPRVHLLATGLRNRQGDTLGVLVLLHCDRGEPSDLAMQSPEHVAFVEAVSGVAALCIDSQRLLERQKQLLNAFIQLIAGAIDAKSPYTGGHCQRVPEITLMLARAAADSDAPAFRDYRPNAEEWETLHIAAWLHDCGKVTTPEYVVDKATKLEALYDRIHEVRTRFEVLKRDAWIAYWQGCAQGGEQARLAVLRDAALATLDDEFALVARSNLGSEAMAEADLARLQQIATRTWIRTLDDRLGLSWEETQRHERRPAPNLPVEEPLLADKPEHLIERAATEIIPPDNPWGFKLEVPKYKFNRGELHNLSIPRGTLTGEERYIINHHIVQSILMLDRLPFPAHLQNVTEIAGGHHERMDGNGYPKRLRREQMSLPARMMAIADIFEALTAADRPYKQGKRLSESLNIMAAMCADAHIDPDLFRLFVRAGVYRHYAERFMHAQQIDEVDELSVLSKAGLTG
ncbi:HD domain-containing phosphohydrolase [Pseudomonas sp. sp1636]|uniref:HD domain-containing phosphohydrolase n=1 Tax=Pseudomonas sp. sp1636 TaxID=3036707 RepID=UPI0025A53E51|nr:HD domain-containing phosphohydrolase [Pseudomonas sp. sp1636]MDM8350069.1 HD domain-containing phosphohydrolase [Pseudomonas sp. sp1636]